MKIRRSLIGLSAAASLGLGLDYLDGAAEGASQAGQTLAHCLRSARAAWERRQQAAGARAGGTIAPRPSSAVLMADFLTELHEGPGAARRPSLAFFDQLSEWLLERATAPLADPAEQRATQRYLAAALRSEEGAEALLARPGAAPRVLQLAAASAPLQQLLAGALVRSAPPRSVPAEDVADVLSLLGAAAQQLRSVQRTAAAASSTRTQQQQAELALQLLLAWAGASPANATCLAEAGAGPQLADLAALTATGTGVDGMQTMVAELMGTLARHAAAPQALRMEGWLYHLLCFAADAAASSQWHLAAAALSSFASCVLRGCELPAQMMQRNTLPLLHQLAAAPGSPAQPAIALVVQALAEGPGVRLPEEEREFWSERLLQWLVELPGSGTAAAADASSQGRIQQQQQQQQQAQTGAQPVQEKEAQQLMRHITAALEALATPAGSQGLHVAHAWLAEMIVHLSRQVQPYNEVPMPPEASRAAAEAAEASAGSSRWWWPFGSSGTAVPAPPAAAGAAAAAAALQADPAGSASDAEAQAAAAAAAASSPYMSLDAAATSSLEAASSAASGSWWKPRWWPWGGSEEEGAASVAKGAAASRPSDSELSLYINASEIGPVYARSVAAALLEASGRVGELQEPPADAEELMGPEAVAVYSQVAAAIDMDLADNAVCSALKVLCALASGGSLRRSWLLDAGILPLLHRLTMERARDVEELPSSAGKYVDAAIPLCIQRQAVRLLAMLACDKAGAGEVEAAGWIPWLQDLALSQDLKISSCASRALLHIESAVATERPGLARLALSRAALRSAGAPLLPTEQHGVADAAAAAAAALGSPAGGPQKGAPGSPRGEAAGMVAEAAEMLGEARHALVQARRRLDRKLDAVRPPLPPDQRLVMQDGVHLFDPLAPHHDVLAREGISADTADAPLLDIVFIHGIRGGAFATWRREGVLERGQARESLDRSVCWPSSWVAKEIPEARLLSIEYAAPVSGWEGEALPFQGTVAQLMEKLAAAGVGQRPVIFVTHSMGGLVVKDMLVTAKQQKDERLRRLHSAAAGAVFYSVPHAGSRLADWGWYLRYVGGSPAKHVRQLKTGPHLDELNAAVRAMCKSGQLPVLSFSEGLPTKLAYIPTHVVPHESAYPGYGDFVVLAEHDHISVCKPADTEDPAYARLMAFLRARVHDLRLQRAEAEARRLDHMEAAAM
ncbi:hypothetical protein ABPG75_006965 [Micractinium tetrahymenae]